MGPWYEENGPNGIQVRKHLLDHREDRDFICYRKAVYGVIKPDMNGFGSWRGYSTFGLDGTLKDRIEQHYHKHLKQMELIQKVLSRYVQHRLYRAEDGLRVSMLKKHFEEAANHG